VWCGNDLERRQDSGDDPSRALKAFHFWPLLDHLVSACILLLARLMGQYCFACWRLLLLSVTLLAGQAHMYVGRCRVGHVGSQAADTARRASTVMSRYGDTLLIVLLCVMWCLMQHLAAL